MDHGAVCSAAHDLSDVFLWLNSKRLQQKSPTWRKWVWWAGDIWAHPFEPVNGLSGAHSVNTKLLGCGSSALVRWDRPGASAAPFVWLQRRKWPHSSHYHVHGVGASLQSVVVVGVRPQACVSSIEGRGVFGIIWLSWFIHCFLCGPWDVWKKMDLKKDLLFGGSFQVLVCGLQQDRHSLFT